MKHILYILICAAALFSCDKLPANGDLDGMWQIMEIERGDSVENVKTKQLYMSIQLKLFQLDDVPNDRLYIGYFEYKGYTLRFWKTSYPSKNESDKDDNVVIEPSRLYLLHPFGLSSTDETFTVDKLTRDVLILHNDSTRITYRKF